MDNLAGSGEESQKYERTIPKAFSSSLKLIKSHLFPLLIRIRAALDPLVQCAPPLTCFINLTMTNLQILLPFTLIGTKDIGNTFLESCSHVWRGKESLLFLLTFLLLWLIASPLLYRSYENSHMLPTGHMCTLQIFSKSPSVSTVFPKWSLCGAKVVPK